MALRYLIVTQVLIQVIFAFSSPPSFGCQVQQNCLNRQQRANRCRRQDNPPLGLPANDNNVNGFTNSLPFNNGMPFGNVPFRTGLPNGFGLNNGLPNSLPVNNRLPGGLPNGFPNGLSNGLPNGLLNGLPNGLPMNNGLPNGLPMNNGLPNFVPMNNRFPNNLPVNNFPNGQIPNNGLPNGLINGLPMNNRYSLNSPFNNGFPSNIPSPSFNAPTNRFLPNPNGINNGFLNSVPNGLPINNLPLNGFQNLNNGIGDNMSNLNNLPANNNMLNVNNMPSINNFQSDPPNIDGTLGNGQVIQNNFPNTFLEGNGLPNNYPQINNDGLPNTNLPLTNSIPIQNELPNLNNMQFTFIPRRFDNIPDNGLLNTNNPVNGYPGINGLQNNNGFQFNNALPNNNYQPNYFIPENRQLRPLNGVANYSPNVNYIPQNAMNPVPIFNNWGLANSLQTRDLSLVPPEMLLQQDFNNPNMLTQLPYGLSNFNMPIDFQTVLPTNPGLNTLRIEGFGNLPIINGFPVAGITETVTLLDDPYKQ